MALQRAFQLSLNGSDAELRGMLASGEVQANATRQDGMYRGFSLLHAAASKGHVAVADMLLRAGASVTAKNAAGKTPVQLAAEKGHPALAAHLQSAAAAPGGIIAPPPAQVMRQPSLPAPSMPAPSMPAPSMPAQPPARSCGSAGFWAAETAASDMDAHAYAPPPAPQRQLQAAAPPMMTAAMPVPPVQVPQAALFPPAITPQLSPHAQPYLPPHVRNLPQQQHAPPPQAPPPQAPPPQAPPVQPAPATMSFGQPPASRAAAPSPAPPPGPPAPTDAAAAAVEAVLNAHADKVSEGAYLAVIPAAALPNLIGDNQEKIRETCARLGALVDVGHQESGGTQLAWVRVTASTARAAESMLWEVVSCVDDGEACGAGFPLPKPSTLDAAFVEAAKGASQARAIVQSTEKGLVLISAASASLHTALLLLLRDGLGTEASSHREALAFTAFPAAITAVRAALKAIPAAEAHRARLMLPASRPGASPSAPRWAFLATDRGFLDAAAGLVGTAVAGSGEGGALQSLHGVRVSMEGSPGGASSLPAPPPLPAAFGGGARLDAERGLAAKLVSGLDLGTARPLLSQLGAISPASARRLRAACFANMRARLSQGGGTLPDACGALQWLDGAIAMIDSACGDAETASAAEGGRPGSASGSAPPILIGGGSGARATSVPTASTTLPVLSFGGSSAPPRSDSTGSGHEPKAEPAAGSSSAAAAAAAAAEAITSRLGSAEASQGGAARRTDSEGGAAAGNAGGGGGASEESDSSDSESDSAASSADERRRRKRKKKEKKETKRRKEKKERKEKRRKSEPA